MRRYSESHKEMRVSTLMKVINAVREGASSKNEIQEKTGLSWGSCSEIITLLSDENLIKSSKIDNKNEGRPGRKATGFEFNSKKFLLAGMELKAQSVACSLVSLGKVELNREEYQLPEKLTNDNVYQQNRKQDNPGEFVFHCLEFCIVPSQVPTVTARHP